MNSLSEIEAILAAILSGAKYGFKIRFPHALLMTFLFRRDLPLEKKIQMIKDQQLLPLLKKRMISI